MVSKQWLLATSFVTRKHFRTRSENRHVIALDAYRRVQAPTVEDSRIDLGWPSLIDAMLSKVDE